MSCADTASGPTWLTPDQASEAVLRLWQRHVVCTKGLAAAATLTALPDDVASSLSIFGSFVDSFRDERMRSITSHAVDIDESFALTVEDVQRMVSTAVLNRFSHMHCDGTLDPSSSDDWVSLYKPQRCDEVRAWLLLAPSTAPCCMCVSWCAGVRQCRRDGYDVLMASRMENW